MYALNLAADGRILSICKVLSTTPEELPRVDNFPANSFDYRYRDGRFVFDPLPSPAPETPAADRLDVIESQILYTALMTGTLLGTEE